MQLKEFLLSRGLAALLCLLCLIATPAKAVTFADKTFAQLVSEAEQIFVGTLSSLQSRKLPDGVIVTDVRFSDIQALKGASISSDIVLLVLGGEVDGLRLEIPGVPQLQPAARYLVFSRGNGKDMFPVVGGPAGIFRIGAELPGGSAIVLDWSGKPLASRIAADVLGSVPLQAQGTSQLPITLEAFRAAIMTRLAGQ